MFSSPTMQMAERIFTVSVIMCGCFGSIALDSSKRLLSSPKILCKPYWEKQKAHSEKVGLALETHHQFKILRDSPNPSLPQGVWQYLTKTLPKRPGQYCWSQVSVPSLALEVFSWERDFQLLRRTPGPCKSSTHPDKSGFIFYVWNTSAVWKNLLFSHFITQAHLWYFSKLSRGSFK